MMIFSKTVISLFAAITLSSCDSKRFAAGSNVDAERIEISCPTTTLIEQLSNLKSARRYQSDADGISVDGPSWENKKWYFFTFFCHEQNFALHFYLESGSSNSSTIVLVSFLDLNGPNKWQVINREKDAQKQQQVLNWFNQTILPALACP